MNQAAAGIFPASQVTTKPNSHAFRQPQNMNSTGRAQLMHQSPLCIWLTGLSASGKTTIAGLLKQRLDAAGLRTYLLVGDVVRQGLCRDLGYSPIDRIENIRRASEVARLLVDAGLIMLVAFISPFRSERRMVRNLFNQGNLSRFLPIHHCLRVKVATQKGCTPKRDEVKACSSPGINSSYDPPEAPEVHLPTEEISAERCVERILGYLRDAIRLSDDASVLAAWPEGQLLGKI